VTWHGAAVAPVTTASQRVTTVPAVSTIVGNAGIPYCREAVSTTPTATAVSAAALTATSAVVRRLSSLALVVASTTAAVHLTPACRRYRVWCKLCWTADA
jgi:hypothetical protein